MPPIRRQKERTQKDAQDIPQKAEHRKFCSYHSFAGGKVKQNYHQIIIEEYAKQGQERCKQCRVGSLYHTAKLYNKQRTNANYPKFAPKKSVKKTKIISFNETNSVFFAKIISFGDMQIFSQKIK
jgi:hypothetical protein